MYERPENVKKNAKNGFFLLRLCFFFPLCFLARNFRVSEKVQIFGLNEDLNELGVFLKVGGRRGDHNSPSTATGVRVLPVAAIGLALSVGHVTRRLRLGLTGKRSPDEHEVACQESKYGEHRDHQCLREQQL